MRIAKRSHTCENVIGKEFPDDAFLGEEQGESGGRSGRRWIVDPIDGTFSFVHGVPFYGVLIGLEFNSEPQLGVINTPALGELIAAARGRGCRWNQKTARVSTINQLDQALLLATDFGACRHQGYGREVAELEDRVAQRRTWGDCYGHLLVATGRAEVMLDPIMNIWDCAALLPILEEAGGTFTDWQGTRTIKGGNAISTNKVLFDPVMKTLRPQHN
ncbi:MAG: inositol monophosphatase family protein [Pyrinomonadaceae bacterium]